MAPTAFLTAKEKKSADVFIRMANKHGEGFMLVKANCWLSGTWVKGEFHGPNNEFIYPDKSKIIGTVENGGMNEISQNIIFNLLLFKSSSYY